MPVFKHDDLEAEDMIPGFKVRFVHGESMTLAYWDVNKGAELP